MTPNILDVKPIVAYLETLVNLPSPTGYTAQVEQFLISNAQQKQIRYEQTRKGAVIYRFAAPSSRPGVMFAAHVDTLGAIVKDVSNDAVTLSPIGKSPVVYLIGDYCQIHAFDGTVYEGTILPNNPAVHVNKGLDEMALNIENLFVRLDLPGYTGETLPDHAIEVGNFVSFDPKFRCLNGFVKSRHLDDKASAAILLYLADLLNDRAISLTSNISLYFNVTEETGQGIAGFPDVQDFIVVDMGVVGQTVAGDEFHVSICAKDSSGPYNYDLTQTLIRLSKRHHLSYKTDIFPYYGSDGSAALRAGGDMRVALVGPGVSASHGYERTHVDSLLNTARLLLSYLDDQCIEGVVV